MYERCVRGVREGCERCVREGCEREVCKRWCERGVRGV